jgi:hypothetical protein
VRSVDRIDTWPGCVEKTKKIDTLSGFLEPLY